LYVAATTHDLDDNVEFDMPFPSFQKAIRRHVGWWEWNNARKGSPELGIEIKVNAAVLYVSVSLGNASKKGLLTPYGYIFVDE
jgi:hypothetical protein